MVKKKLYLKERTKQATASCPLAVYYYTTIWKPIIIERQHSYETQIFLSSTNILLTNEIQIPITKRQPPKKKREVETGG